MRKAEIGVRGGVGATETAAGASRLAHAGRATGGKAIPASRGVAETDASASRTPRQCGPCRACCRVFDIPELGKALNVLCRHANADRRKPGCGIYAERPSVCREFECAWKQGLAGDGDRPDRLGVMMYVVPLADGEPGLGVVEVRPGAFETPRVAAMLAEYNRRKPGRVIVRRAAEPRFRTVGLMVEGKPVRSGASAAVPTRA